MGGKRLFLSLLRFLSVELFHPSSVRCLNSRPFLIGRVLGGHIVKAWALYYFQPNGTKANASGRYGGLSPRIIRVLPVIRYSILNTHKIDHSSVIRSNTTSGFASLFIQISSNVSAPSMDIPSVSSLLTAAEESTCNTLNTS